MAEIVLENLAHSYSPQPQADGDWALRELNLTWRDGGSYALLGPSGCGKTTLLNIISGLLTPSSGRVLFDGVDVSGVDPNGRNIAQVFQFPVVYDTMTVFRNLAFPLQNRGLDAATVTARVNEVAEMLELSDSLHRRARGLNADDKQKISLGRALVRPDVNVIMLDEPLTVIDPHLKWQLRSQLGRLQRRFGFTMIYVTHDQTEALTLAERIVVLHDGRVVQSGTPEELFERPQHTFVGHFIGSPGMNRFPAAVRGGVVRIGDAAVAVSAADVGADGGAEVGVRPEHIRLSDGDGGGNTDGNGGNGNADGNGSGFPITIRRINDVGRFVLVEAELSGMAFTVYVPEGGTVPTQNPHAHFDPAHTHLYLQGWLQ